MPSGFPKKPWDIILLHVNIRLIFSLFNNPAFAKKKLDREYKIQAIRSYRHYFTHVHSVCYLKIEVGLCFFAPVKSINNKSCIYIAFFKPINYNSKQFSRWLTKQKQDGNGENMLLLDFSYVACSKTCSNSAVVSTMSLLQPGMMAKAIEMWPRSDTGQSPVHL